MTRESSMLHAYSQFQAVKVGRGGKLCGLANKVVEGIPISRRFVQV